MIRVGFIFAGTDDWLGGSHYFKYLLRAVHAVRERRIEPVIITGRRTPAQRIAGFPPLEVIRTAMLDRATPLWAARKLCLRLTDRDLVLERLLVRNNIAVLSHSGLLGRRGVIPTIDWIPDFQHRHLPRFFSPQECESRDRGLVEICERSSYIVLSSFDAQKDLHAFHHGPAPQSAVLQFVADLGGVASFSTMQELQQRYQFEGRYFHVPNQFWAHKNHRLIVDALKILKAQGRTVKVLATGNTNDPRQPDHFASLTRYVEESQVSDCFRVLGLVPYADLISLMRNSVALINPSLFEGWSSTVEEAKSLGKSTVLSNIPVHLEQAPERGIYFDSGDASSLAAAMWQVWSAYDPEADRHHVETALSRLEDRKRAFGRRYEDIVLEALKAAGPAVTTTSEGVLRG